jgi:hypothetical protein
MWNANDCLDYKTSYFVNPALNNASDQRKVNYSGQETHPLPLKLD